MLQRVVLLHKNSRDMSAVSKGIKVCCAKLNISLYMIRDWAPPSLCWILFPRGWRVLWRWAMLVQLVSPLVEGWSFPGSWSVVYHSAWKAPAAFWGDPSLWWRMELSVVAMQTRPPMLSVRKKKGLLVMRKWNDGKFLVPLTSWTHTAPDLRVSPQSCWHCCPSLHSDLPVLLYNRYVCQPGCWMSMWSCDASFGSQMAALYHPKHVEDVCTPLRYSCPGHGWLFCPH